MNKLRFIFVFFLFLVLPIKVFATEAKIIPIFSGLEGDCVLIESNNQYLLVDTCTTTNVFDYVNNYIGNNKFSIMISHYHNDHLALLVNWSFPEKLLEKLDTIYLPDTKYLADYYDSNGPWYITYSYTKILTKVNKYNTDKSEKDKIKVVHLWPTACTTPNVNFTYTYNDKVTYAYDASLYEYNNYQCYNNFTFGDVKVEVIGPINVCTDRRNGSCGTMYDVAGGHNGSRYGHYINDHSLVTMFTIGNVKYLSAGDIESSVELSSYIDGFSASSSLQEEKLVNAKCDELSADILKLNHHGLPTSNSNAFLYCVKPKFVFYTMDNETNYDAQQVLAEINQMTNDWRHHFNIFSTYPTNPTEGNKTFIFHIKDNQIQVEKVSGTNGTVGMTDVTLNYVDSDTNATLGTSTASFSSKYGVYYYLTDYAPTHISYGGNDYIYDFQKNSNLTTGGTSVPSSVIIYYKKSNYVIDQENKVIKGIDFHLKGTTLYSALGFTTANNAAYYRDNLLDARSDILRTGDEIIFTMNNRENIYKIAVTGDIEGKGYLTSEGVIKAAKHILDGNILDISKSSAADYNEDGVIKMNDILRMLNKIDMQKEDNGFVTEGSSKYYYDNDTGEMHIGWLNYQNDDYYFNKDGKMVNSWNVIDGRLYYFDENGALVNNMEGYSFNQIQNSEDKPYLIANSGFLELAGKKHYSSGNNTFTTGWLHLDDNWYYFDETGKMLKSDWYQIVNSPRTYQYWYYFDEDGKMLKGWQKIGDYWYYLNDSGRMLKGWQQLEYNGTNQWYYFTPAGLMSNTGWKRIDYEWYYFFPGGAMATEWQQIDNKWYYLGSNGKMVSGKCITISGSNYCFNSSGVCTSGSGC